mmetsp:Transcript_102121/g.181375  ORF Transcript_102121/g.181375 Transcript_102121/m.181375 type:complete len:222 (+) Transcript_102121:1228-1893(+)
MFVATTMMKIPWMRRFSKDMMMTMAASLNERTSIPIRIEASQVLCSSTYALSPSGWVIVLMDRRIFDFLISSFDLWGAWLGRVWRSAASANGAVDICSRNSRTISCLAFCNSSTISCRSSSFISLRRSCISSLSSACSIPLEFLSLPVGELPSCECTVFSAASFFCSRACSAAISSSHARCTGCNSVGKSSVLGDRCPCSPSPKECLPRMAAISKITFSRR